MNKDAIVKELASLGDDNRIFFNTPLYHLLGAEQTKGYLSLLIAFSLGSGGSRIDEPNSVIVWYYSQRFDEHISDSEIAQSVNESAIRYANNYLIPVSKLMKDLNTGESFNRIAGLNGKRKIPTDL